MHDSNSIMSEAVPQFKVLLIGPRNVGKTSWLRLNKSGEFSEKYFPTSWKDKEETQLTFLTTCGPVALDFQTR